MSEAKIKLIVLPLLFGALVFVAGCRDITTTTTIFPDGSCERTMVVEGDSSEVEENPYLSVSDTSWRVEIGKDEENRRTVLTATKRFHTISGLAEELSAEADGKPRIRIDVRLKKRFRFFNTFLIYRETYRAYNPFQLVPLPDHLSEEDVELYFSDRSDEEIDDKVQEWLWRSVFEEFYQGLVKAAKDLGEPELSIELLQSKKEELHERVVERLENSDDEEVVKDILEVTADVLGTREIWMLKDEIAEVVQQIVTKSDFLEQVTFDDFESRVVMPGLIIDTNAEKMEGNAAAWEIDSGEFFNKDYQMWVESRVVNGWVIWTTAIVVIIILTLAVAGTLRARRI